MHGPLVTVICLCYNQQRFVEEAIESVLAQTYQNIELIIVDDASSDNSAATIKNIISKKSEIQFLPLSKNLGNCKAFNCALAISRGEYIIDLAADDILLPDRISKGVKALVNAGNSYGVNFTDAEWISEQGQNLYKHSERFPHTTIPRGNIYRDLIANFFICSPTMMYRRSVMDQLKGYDENLAYEDFDFWIRSSREFLYCYTPEVLVKKRIVSRSMSAKQFKPLNSQMKSTFMVCEKIMKLNRTQAEQSALNSRLLYEMRMSLRLLNLPLALKYLQLYFKNKSLKY
jgi:glycosyltransferase involved in cell wall biosynthesis